ncbi:MAG: AAA family ATPase, partial [bacterium]
MELPLKEIHLEGFKSFRDKTTLKFEGPLTAIVGPNGSGKSNVVDAIKWVMGDQSPKSVRAATGMEAIYRPAEGNGGEPSGFASVTVKLDNINPESPDEPAEWEIERRYYRSGESAYSINDRIVRLKDVRSLMGRMGFGLGSLSVVGQGEIDGFLSLVPLDRRLVFEDLARISDFKANKRKILSQLDDCARNHDRLRDLIGEISVRVDRLSTQAIAAKKHAELAESADELKSQMAAQEYLLARRNLDRNESKLGEIKTELEILVAEFDSKSVILADTRKALENAREENQRTLLECESGRREHERAVAEERRLTEACHHFADLIDTLEDELAERTSRVKKLKARITELEGIAENADVECELAARKRSEFELFMSRRRGFLRACTRERERLRSKAERLSGEGSLFARDAEFHNRRADALLRDQEILNNRKAELLKSVETENSESENLRNTHVKLQSIIKANEEILSKVENEYGCRKADLDFAGDRARKFSTEIAAMKRECDILRELEEAHEGYGEGVKAILARRDNFEGLHGSLGELIEVETGREKPVECVLGDALGFLVCDTLSQAKKIVDFVRSGNLGSVTVIVSELVESSETKSTEGDLRNFVSIKNGLDPIIDLFLSGAQEIDSIENFDPKELRKVLVTSDGTVFRSPAFLSGGAISQASPGIIGRRARIRELELSIKQLGWERASVEASIHRLNAEIVRLKSIEARIKAELNSLNDKMRSVEAEEKDTISRLKQAEKSLSETDGKLEENLAERETCIESAHIASCGVQAALKIKEHVNEELEHIEK